MRATIAVLALCGLVGLGGTGAYAARDAAQAAPAAIPPNPQQAIKGQDVLKGEGKGPTGWVQAPIPRGTGVSRVPPGSAAGNKPGAGQPAQGGGGPHYAPGQDPGAPVIKGAAGPAEATSPPPAR